MKGPGGKRPIDAVFDSLRNTSLVQILTIPFLNQSRILSKGSSCPRYYSCIFHTNYWFLFQMLFDVSPLSISQIREKFLPGVQKEILFFF